MTCRVDSIAVWTLLLQDSTRFWQASCAPPKTDPKPAQFTEGSSKGPTTIFWALILGNSEVHLLERCLDTAVAEMCFSIEAAHDMSS